MSYLLPVKLEANFAIQRYVGGDSSAIFLNATFAIFLNATLHMKAISGLEFDANIQLSPDESLALRQVITSVLARAQELHDKGEIPLDFPKSA